MDMINPFLASGSPELSLSSEFGSLSLTDPGQVYLDGNGFVDPQLLYNDHLSARMTGHGEDSYEYPLNLPALDLAPSSLHQSIPSACPSSAASITPSVLAVYTPPYTPSVSPVSSVVSSSSGYSSSSVSIPVQPIPFSTFTAPASGCSPAPSSTSSSTSSRSRGSSVRSSHRSSTSSSSSQSSARRGRATGNRSRNVQSDMNADVALTLAWRNKKCPVCGTRPRGARTEEFKRHVKSHFRSINARLCAGVPVTQPRSPLSYFFQGQWYDGGFQWRCPGARPDIRRPRGSRRAPCGGLRTPRRDDPSGRCCDRECGSAVVGRYRSDN